MKINRNVLECPFCGTGIYTQSEERLCYKCETPMIFIRKEEQNGKR